MLRNYLLTEHVVTNPDAVDRYVARWVKDAQTKEGKEWFTKRLRALILNDEKLLRPTTTVAMNAPEYVRKAVSNGETIYEFNSANVPGEFTNRIQHIQDFFNSLADFAQRTPGENAVQNQGIVQAQKWLSKLNKMTPDQVDQAAETWAKQVGGRADRLTKDGVEVIYQWDDGMYAVRYTELNTMMRDGHDLQNCLRQGTYWNNVQQGNQWVVSIRKPNDEAVVGMRWTIRNGKPTDIVECKGKQNQPAGSQYVPYIVDLLPRFGITNVTHDLSAAGIFANHGRYGTFKEIASHKKVGEAEYWRTDSKFIVKIGRHEIDGALEKGNISKLNFADTAPPMVCRMLNALSPQESNKDFKGIQRTVRHELFRFGVFQGKNGFGGAKEVGEHLGTAPGKDSAPVPYYKVASPDGDGYLVMEHPKKSILTNISDNLVVSIDDDVFRVVDPGQFFNILNTAKVKGNVVFDNSYSFRYGFVYTPQGYRPIQNVATVIGKAEGADIWEYGKKLWMFETSDNSFSALRLTRGGVLDAVFTSQRAHDIGDPIARFLCQRYSFTDVEGVNHAESGIVKLPSGIIATAEKFIDAMEKMGKDAVWTPTYLQDIEQFDEYISKGGFDDLNERELDRLYAAIDPITQKTFYKVETIEAKDLSVYGLTVAGQRIIVPTMLFWFQEIWSSRPHYRDKVLEARGIVQDKLVQFIENRKEKTVLRMAGQYGRGGYYNNASRLFPTAWAAMEKRNDEIERELVARAKNAPDGADIADRYGALNTLRRIKK